MKNQGSKYGRKKEREGENISDSLFLRVGKEKHQKKLNFYFFKVYR